MTINSKYLIVKGMFPSGIPGRDFPLKNGWPTQWTPIPVHTIPTQSDNVHILPSFFFDKTSQSVQL